MSKIFTPTNQTRLTNVSVVRLKKGKKRFEIACYRNKVIAWRNKLEKDIDEVLQTHTIFINVSKGQVAKKEDLITHFATDNQTEICKLILEKGELQVTDKERHSLMESRIKDVALLVASKCVNSESKKPFPVSTIEKAMKDISFSVNINKSTKEQALVVMEDLKSTLPIQRAQLRVRVLITGCKDAKKVRDKVLSLAKTVEETDQESSTINIICLIEPGSLKSIDDLIRNETHGKGQVDILNSKEIEITED